MAKPRQILCPGCFRRKPKGVACPFPDCQFSEKDGADPLYLPYRTKLKDKRYVTGRIIGRGEYSAIYLGLDTKDKYESRQRVAIKEYLPWAQAIRQDRRSLVVDDDHFQGF